MRTLFIIFTFLSCCCVSLALPDSSSNNSTKEPIQTLIPSGPIESGGFGALVVKAGPFGGETGIAIGGRGGWVINRTFVIGGGGYGFTDGIHFNKPSTDTSTAFGYGGLELEYLINSNNVVHATVLTLIGAGGFSVFRRQYLGETENQANHLYSASCFVVEPAVNAEVNILSWMRLQLGVGYRFVTGIDAMIGGKHYTSASVSGLFGQGTIKFGPY